MKIKEKKYSKNTHSNAKTDALLIKKISKGDQSAFKILFINYHPRLIKYCSYILEDDIALASKITEQALIDVWSTASSYTGNTLPYAWIHSIARFKLISYFKKYYSEVLKIDDASIATSKVNKADFLSKNLFGNNKRKNQLTGSLGKLHNEHKEILELVYIKELPITEISNRLKISENTVIKRMFYARKNFKTIYSNKYLEKTCDK